MKQKLRCQSNYGGCYLETASAFLFRLCSEHYFNSFLYNTADAIIADASSEKKHLPVLVALPDSNQSVVGFFVGLSVQPSSLHATIWRKE